MKSTISEILERISAVEETVILALDSSSMPPQADSVAVILKQNRANLNELHEILDKEEVKNERA